MKDLWVTTEMHQKPSKPVLPRSWPFSVHNVGKTSGATLHRDHRGSAACRPCLPSPQEALGSLSWRSSVSFHALPPTSHMMPLQGETMAGVSLSWLCCCRAIFTCGEKRSWGFFWMWGVQVDGGQASQDGRDEEDWRNGNVWTKLCAGRGVRGNHVLPHSGLNPRQRAQQSRNLSE